MALAGLFLLLPAMACGQTRQPPQQANARLSRPTTDMTLQDFTARHERRILAADTDGDGKVSRAEFLASATSGKGDPARRFGRFDRNGDGLIDRQEIAAIMARRFERRDTDGDGRLTSAERTAARAAEKHGDAES
ncbi:EF-hand domain-containing protein [Sphingomonas sp. 1P08PE]|uniref:EF-hand domain-containing protein n=1 Tax=Sphingomonas sp. 1P08PE TaxID=554122 RepID=UPI0039A3F813